MKKWWQQHRHFQGFGKRFFQDKVKYFAKWVNSDDDPTTNSLNIELFGYELALCKKVNQDNSMSE
jgi:hypothetical protein